MFRWFGSLPLAGIYCFLTAATAGAVTVLPNFDAASFVRGAPIDNPYLPWRVGARSAQVAQGVDDDGEAFEERDVQRVIGPGPDILGVRTTKVLDRAFEDGILAEKTHDFYAQDSDGNVWYMGEDTVAYEYNDAGMLIGTSTEGSWRAGLNGALPGFAMPVRTDLGFAYYQEFATKDGALDEAETVGLLDALKVGDTLYRHVLKTLETTAAEPDSREFKYYAPGVGLIRVEEGLDENLANPDVTFDRVSTVPLPPGLLLLMSAVGGLLFVRRQRTTTFAPV